MRELTTRQLKDKRLYIIHMMAEHQSKIDQHQSKITERQHQLKWVENYMIPIFVDNVEMSQQDAAALLRPGVYSKNDRQQLLSIAMCVDNEVHEAWCTDSGVYHTVSNRWTPPVPPLHETSAVAAALMGLTVWMRIPPSTRSQRTVVALELETWYWVSYRSEGDIYEAAYVDHNGRIMIGADRYEISQFGGITFTKAVMPGE
jgi:hypothetical protein